MLAKKLKLTGSRDYAKVQNEGKVSQFESFGVALLDRKDSSSSRYGFVVSTKIAKAAVDRNRFKRAMSEAVRLNSVCLKDGYDVVFLAKPCITKVPTSDIMREVRDALRELNLMK